MNIKLTSKFKPFTFDEMVKPLQNYKEAYDKVEEQYGALSEKTEMWKDIADKTNSPEAYAMYKKYSDELQAITNDFATGMTMQNRSQLLGMRRRYAAEIIPIENAKKAFDKMIETREKISAADDSAIFVNHYNSIDDFLHGGTADNTYVSGNKLMARVAAKCEAYGRSEYGKMEIAKTVSRGYQDLYEQKNGYSYADLKEVLEQHPNSKAAQDINAIIQSELHSAGYDNLNDFDKSKLVTYAESGAYSGLSKPAFQFVDSGLAHAQNYEMENKRLAQADRHFYAQLAQADRHHKDQMRAARNSSGNSSYERKQAAMIDLIASGKATEAQARALVFGTEQQKIQAAKQIGKQGKLVDDAVNYETAINNPASEDKIKKLNIKAGHGGLNVTRSGGKGKITSSTLSPQAFYDVRKNIQDDGIERWDKHYSIGNFGKGKDGRYIYTGGGTHPVRDYKRLTWSDVQKQYPSDAQAIREHFTAYGEDPVNYHWAKDGGGYLFDDKRLYPTGYHYDAPRVVVAGKKANKNKTSGRKNVSR